MPVGGLRVDTTLPSARSLSAPLGKYPSARLCAHVYPQEDEGEGEVVLGASMDYGYECTWTPFQSTCSVVLRFEVPTGSSLRNHSLRAFDILRVLTQTQCSLLNFASRPSPPTRSDSYSRPMLPLIIVSVFPLPAQSRSVHPMQTSQAENHEISYHSPQRRLFRMGVLYYGT